MSDAPAYRHELKYYINQGMHALLSKRLSLTMEPDGYARKSGGEYFIRSLYFDDPDNSAFNEKLAGVNERDKYRIRVYNMSEDTIKLECKHKQNDYILKRSVLLDRGEAESLINGEYRFLFSRSEPFARQMGAEFATKRLKPRVIVDYVREPYVFALENVRVTFDMDVRTAFRSTDIFNPDIPTYPVLDRDMVLEVKFAKYLPSYIRELLQLDSHERSAISKYCLCRKFEL